MGINVTKKIIDEAQLRKLYIDEGKTLKEIATTLNVTPRTIQCAIERYNIPKRKPGFVATISKEDIIKLYVVEEYSFEDIGKMYNLSHFLVKKHLLQYGVKVRSAKESKNTSKIRAKTGATNMERYGGTSPLDSEEVRKKKNKTNLEKYGGLAPAASSKVVDKMKKTNLEKYGTTSYTKTPEYRAKSKQTSLSNWGVDNPSKSPEIIARKKNTTQKNYGVDYTYQSPELQERIRQTNLKKYGVENPSRSPEIQARKKETNIERYGFDNPAKSPSVKENMEATNIERYGAKSPAQNPVIMNKIITTNLERYGVEHIFQLPEIWEQIKQTNMTRYGFEYAFQSPIVQDKIKQTNLERCGFDNPAKSPSVQEKMVETNLARYGFAYTFQSPEIREQIKQTNMTRYGFDNPAKNPEVKEKMETTNLERYGKPFYSQIHISDESVDIMKNKEKFESFIDKKHPRIIAESLGVDSSTVYKYAIQYDFELNYDRSRSSGETEVANFLESLDLELIDNDRKIIKPFELDIVIPEKKIAIEYCGLYWHSERFKDKNYHKTKMERTNNAGYRLITIWEDEWLSQKDLIKKKLISILGMGDKGIFARKCQIDVVDKKVANKFLNQHHIQGMDSTGKIFIGSWHEGNLISVVSYREKEPGKYELVRFASDGRNHPGLFSKMLKFFERTFNPTVIQSFADLRWSEGNMYKQTGFEIDSTQLPTYYYVKDGKVYHKFSFRKAKIKKMYPEVDIENNTEKQLMESLDIPRIWDCGKIKFTKTFK